MVPGSLCAVHPQTCTIINVIVAGMVVLSLADNPQLRVDDWLDLYNGDMQLLLKF